MYNRLKTKVANLFECAFCNGQENLHPAISSMAAMTLISILVLCVSAVQPASIRPDVLAFYWSIFALPQSTLWRLTLRKIIRLRAPDIGTTLLSLSHFAQMYSKSLFEFV